MNDSAERERRMEAIFREHRDAVMAYVARRAPSVARDVTSETFLIAWRRLDVVPDEPRAWLLGVARRTLANQLRGERRRTLLRERVVAIWQPVGQRDADIDGPAIAAFDALSRADREVLALIAWEGLDYAAAATVLGCSRGAFAVRLHRARKRLADALTEPDDTTPLTTCIPEKELS
jgi:RNA polymerase sigma-70 factor (ECF subfamily)